LPADFAGILAEISALEKEGEERAVCIGSNRMKQVDTKPVNHATQLKSVKNAALNKLTIGDLSQ
jgi:hypothetical protein